MSIRQIASVPVNITRRASFAETEQISGPVDVAAPQTQRRVSVGLMDFNDHVSSATPAPPLDGAISNNQIGLMSGSAADSRASSQPAGNSDSNNNIATGGSIFGGTVAAGSNQSKTNLPLANPQDNNQIGTLLSRVTKSFGSNMSGGSGGSGNGNEKGRELIESFVDKMMEIKSLLAAFIFNILLISLFLTLQSEQGFVTFSIFSISGGVLVQIAVNVSHILTGLGLNEATSLMVGYRMSRPEGFSLTACGYIQAPLLRKLNFTSVLGYRSRAKGLLNKLTYVWIIHVILLFLTIFSSTAITHRALRVDQGTLSCVIYGQSGTPRDRGHPSLKVTMGTAEYVFGTALGNMRSQEPVPVTKFVMPPQLIDQFVDGTTIVGPGHVTDIFSECTCILSLENTDELTAAGTLSKESAQLLKEAFLPLTDSRVLSMANVIDYYQADPINPKNTDNDSIIIGTLINHRNMCGGVTDLAKDQNSLDNAEENGNTFVPFCKTRIYNHTRATIVATYMSDGSTSSIALKTVSIREGLGSGNLSWLHFALTNMFGDNDDFNQYLNANNTNIKGRVSTLLLPETIPGSVNPMLWWTTVNLQGISPAFLDVGLETFFSMTLRSAIQRTLRVKQQRCVQNVVDPGATVLYIRPIGFIFGMIFTLGQLAINLGSLIVCLPRLFSKYPVGPAIKICRDQSYMMLLIYGSFLGPIIADSKSLVFTEELWNRLDVTVRVGESISTKDDTDRGIIVVDKPKFVTNLVTGKRYN